LERLELLDGKLSRAVLRGRDGGNAILLPGTYVKVAGRWCSLYRAIDSDGNLVETMLSKTRDMDAAKRFFQRYYPMRGFGSFDSAAWFCTAHDELRDHLRPRTRFNEPVSLADQRRLFQERWGDVCAVLQAA